MPKRRLEVVILAAGLGTRMKSKTIKVLHAAAGRPIVDYVLDLAEEISDEKPIMVVGYQSRRGEAALRLTSRVRSSGKAARNRARCSAGGGTSPLPRSRRTTQWCWCSPETFL